MRFITPAIEEAGWDKQRQIRREVTFTAGRVIVRGKLVARGKKKRADYLLFWKKNIPLAVVEAKDATHGVGDGMQQALGYAEALDLPFAFSSNGDGFLFHDRTGDASPVEIELGIDAFPSPDRLARFTREAQASPSSDLCNLVIALHHNSLATDSIWGGNDAQSATGNVGGGVWAGLGVECGGAGHAGGRGRLHYGGGDQRHHRRRE